MAVIKIVPMPGAVGDKGDEGAVGPRGLQGEQGLQGVPGADALWNYNGAYNPGAGYAVGDVVTFEGQTWYRKHSNGGNVGDTPSEGLFWDLVAAKGADGEPGLNGLEGETGPQGPAGADGLTPTSGTWNVVFNMINGSMAESGPAIPGVSSTPTYAQYYTVGELVFFDVQYSFENITNFGIGDQYFFTLPFKPKVLPTIGGFQDGAILSPVLTGRIINNKNSVNGLWGNDETIVFGLIQVVSGSNGIVAPAQTGVVYVKLAKEISGKLQVANNTYTVTENLRISSNDSVFRMSGVYRKE